MAFRDILDGRKALVSTKTLIKVAPEVATLMRAFAAQHRLYHVEAASYLITIGLSQHEGWLLDADESLKYLPKPLLGRTRKQLHSNEKATRQAVEGVLAWGCPPEEVIVSADMNPNLQNWCKSKGVKWEHGVLQDIDFPPEYDKDVARDVRD